MNDYPPNQVSPETTNNNSEPSNLDSLNQDELSLLRSVLLGVEPTQLHKLYERLNNPQIQPEDISRLLPEAVVLRSKQDKQLVEAIVSSVEEAIQASVTQDENVLSEAFFPIIGPATRKAIAAALDEMMQSLNQTLEHSLSPESIKWRLEAKRTGKSFAEIILLRTLLYRVEQIFLIHRKTGLLLHHVMLKQVAAQDPDLVAAMLTAIQDFIKDSFTVHNEATLSSLRFGELIIWIEAGPQAIIAGIIRGKPPQELREVFQAAIEKIHLKLGTELHNFEGETEPFQASQPYLDSCLTVQYKTASKQNYTYAWALLGLIAIAGGIWGFFTLREHIRWQAYINKLNSQPGIVVINTKHQNGRHFIWGMRDPLAVDPNTLIQQTHLNPQKVIGKWQPYLSFEPQLLSKRSARLLQPPTTISLQVDNKGILSANGYAPQQWILDAHKLWRFIPGITQFQTQNLLPSELRELQLAKKQIEETIFLFEEGKSELIPGEANRLTNLAVIIHKLFKTANYLGKAAQIQIRGHTNNQGTEQENILISQARANKILSYFNNQGLSKNKFKIVALGSKLPYKTEFNLESQRLNRRVSFQVLIIDKTK
ncbi:OmpA family protein [Nostoc sp. FACHB-152]|uniref:OmpA family protein n=1 Tax=unclassified Nostoc TaxID=2593658 RepID=UPI0016849C48|nr:MULTISPECIES: OmpA family protein [unclassified Nostoc]MBD2447653.1 OmpA family protein [Nostoc sp. FACHB-152]MBD2470644.1 OmpA family protein [Nostoc sp. FACHB-145]